MTKKATTKGIREAVFARAKNRCECDCGRWITYETMRLDHQFGRAKLPQAVSNCWALAIPCDERRTANAPSAASWLQRFAWHAGKHGYAAERELALTKLNTLMVKNLAHSPATRVVAVLRSERARLIAAGADLTKAIGGVK